MKKILFTLLFILNSYGSQLENVLSGSIEVSEVVYKNKLLNITDIVVNNDYVVKDTFKLSTSLGLFTTDGAVYNDGSKQFINELTMLKINELYITSYLTENYHISVGLFPFNKGSFYEHNFNGKKTGTSVYTLTDLTMQGVIDTYIKDDQRVQLGSVYYDKFMVSHYDLNNESYLDRYQDSSIDFISYRLIEDNIHKELLFTNTKQQLDGNVIMDTYTSTVALSYDDEEYSGIVYYGIATKSYTDVDGSVTIDNKDTKVDGHSLLLGIKKEADRLLFGKYDMTFGIEYLKRSTGYHSLLIGKPLSYQSYSDVGDNIYITTGVRFTSNLLFKIKYYRYDSKGKTTSLPYSIVSEELKDGSSGLNRYNSFIFQIYYEF